MNASDTVAGSKKLFVPWWKRPPAGRWPHNDLAPVLDSVVALPAQRGEIAVDVRPEVPDGNDMVYVELADAAGDEIAQATASQAPVPITLANHGAMLWANPLGAIRTLSTLVVWIAMPHRPDGLGAVVVVLSPVGQAMLLGVCERLCCDLHWQSAELTHPLDHSWF